MTEARPKYISKEATYLIGFEDYEYPDEDNKRVKRQRPIYQDEKGRVHMRVYLDECFITGQQDFLENHHILPFCIWPYHTPTLPIVDFQHIRSHRKDTGHLSKVGKKSKHLENRYQPGEPIPYGKELRKDGKALKDNPVEKAAIQKMISYHYKGFDLSDIISLLELESYPPPQNHEVWTEEAIHELLAMHLPSGGD